MNKEQLKEIDRIAGELKALRDDVEYTDIPVEVTSTTEQDKWQRVIDEGYLCKFWDENIGWDGKRECIGRLLVHVSEGRWCCEGNWYDTCEVLREKGIKQPYFQGDDIPDCPCYVYYADNGGAELLEYTDEINWSEVIAYIEV
jgi:hypothetical protein